MTRDMSYLGAVVAIVLCSGASATRAAELRAGVARIDLTPPLELKASLGGYGQRMSRPAEGVHDRIMGKAIVLSDGSRRFALVTADVLGFPPPVKKAVLKELGSDGWTSGQILLLPSHSHTSIDMMQIHPGNKLPIPQLGLFHPKLYERTVKRLAELIRLAASTTLPVHAGTKHMTLVGWNANRRDPSGPVDRQLTVTRIDTASGKPRVVLVNWTAHPTLMAAEDMWYSGGWPGHMQRTLEALIGQGVTVMYYNGAQGDQRPVARPDSGTSRWERAERYGRELALRAYELYRNVQPRADVSFAFHQQAIQLPAPAAHPDFMKTGGAEYGLANQLLSRLLDTLMPSQTHSVSVRLGNLVIVGIPGEAAASLGMDIKRQAARITGASCPTIGGLADQWISYILPADEYEKGGYEASVSFYGPTLGDTIRDGVLEGVKQLASSCHE